MERRRVFKAAYKPMTIAGVDRRLFFLALLLGAATFNLFYSFLGGIVIAVLLYGCAWLAHRQDPKYLDILIATRHQRTAYDAAKRVPEMRRLW